MKKLLAILLAAVLMAALTVPVFASWEEEANVNNVAYTINAFYEAPTINGSHDGDLTWTHLPVVPGDISLAWSYADNAEQIARDLDFDVWMTYDENNIYVLARKDGTHDFNPHSGTYGGIWQYSAIQVNFANYNDWGDDRLEFGIGRNSDDGSLVSYVWAQHPDRLADFELVEGENFTVIRDGSNIWYEVRVPVNTFLSRATVSEGDVIGFCLVLAQAIDGDHGHIHTQIASGCTGAPGKDAERFARVTLGPRLAPAQPEPEPEPEVLDAVEEVAPVVTEAEAAPAAPVAVEADTPKPAPETNDNMIIFISVSVIALAGAAIVRRRVSAKNK